MTEIYIGLLSGTSMDAIDVAAIDFSGPMPKVVATLSKLLPAEYKPTCLEIINSGQCSLQKLGELDHWAGKLFATAVLDFLTANPQINKNNIIAIGSHGQTIWHAPNGNQPFTMQIGDPNIIAVTTGITTIADVRRADVAAGGQGAPLAPAFHHAVFSDPNEPRCILNIGGMSNVSLLNTDNKNTVIGFDTGPGNCLMDNWTKQNYNLEYDQNGEIAQTGKVNNNLLNACLADSYFAKPAPKSTGREQFNDAWLQEKIKTSQTQNLPHEDILATLLELTAITIANAIKQNSQTIPKVFVCGGGYKNSLLCLRLSEYLNQDIQTTTKLGIDPEWMETALFAWIAKQNIYGIATDLRSITGSKTPVILGSVNYTASK